MTNILENLLSISNEIKNVSATSDKQAILRRERHNKDFTDMLKFVYDKTIVTGIDKKKLNKATDKKIEYTDINNFSDLYNYLKNNNTGKDCDIAPCRNFIDNQCNNAEQEDFVK